MPKYLIKDGNYPDEFLDFIQDNEKGTISITAEVETSRKRLRGAFHALLGDWYNSGCYSCCWNGQKIMTKEGLKVYYKYHGCDCEILGYSFGIEESPDRDFFVNNLPKEYHPHVKPIVRPWEKMTKEQQCKAINTMVTDIKNAEEIPRAVEESLQKLEQDREALTSIGYYNYKKKRGLL